MSDDPNCIFCKILRREVPAIVIDEDEHTLAFMDVMPQSDGHVLVIPKRHAPEIFDLQAEESALLMRATHKVAAAVRKSVAPDGMMLMQLNGADAGQTVFHVHFHIVPRYAGQQLRLHAREMADMDRLEKIGKGIRAAL